MGELIQTTATPLAIKVSRARVRTASASVREMARHLPDDGDDGDNGGGDPPLVCPNVWPSRRSLRGDAHTYGMMCMLILCIYTWGEIAAAAAAAADVVAGRTAGP